MTMRCRLSVLLLLARIPPSTKPAERATERERVMSKPLLVSALSAVLLSFYLIMWRIDTLSCFRCLEGLTSVREWKRFVRLCVRVFGDLSLIARMGSTVSPAEGVFVRWR